MILMPKEALCKATPVTSKLKEDMKIKHLSTKNILIPALIPVRVLKLQGKKSTQPIGSIMRMLENITEG